MEQNKTNRMTGLTDAEFLSFLYSERDREESLATYQGWNLWAIVGAIVTVIYALYGVLGMHHADIDTLNVGYILSGMLSLLICYWPIIPIIKGLFIRERGVDANKLRFLEEITPKVYLRSALCCSIVFPVYILLADGMKPWSEVTIFWIISAALFVFGNVAAYRNRKKIVSSVFDELLFTRLRWNAYFVSATSGVLSVVYVGSFKRGYGGIFDSPDFDVAICITACLILLRLFFYINSEIRRSSNIDKILDDYLYKDWSKEDAYYEMQVSRMGRGVLASCGKELLKIRESYVAFEPHKKKMEELITQFDKEEVNMEQINNYYNWLKQAMAYTGTCHSHAVSMDDRLQQISKQAPALVEDEEYNNLLLFVKVLLDRTKEMMDVVRIASDKMNAWLHNNVCEKYGGICTKECSHRHDRPLLKFRLRIMYFRFCCWLFGEKWKEKKIIECVETE